MSSTTERPYCTCNKGTVIDPDRATTQYETDINKDGYCIYCNHVAIWKTIKYKLYPRGESIGGYKPVSACRQQWGNKGRSLYVYDAYYEDTGLSKGELNSGLVNRTRKFV